MATSIERPMKIATFHLKSTETGFSIVETGRPHFVISGATIEAVFSNAAHFYTKVRELNQEMKSRLSALAAKDTPHDDE